MDCSSQCFSPKKITVLERTSHDILKRLGPEVAREADGTHHRVDGIPEARWIMIRIFLDDVTPCNAPPLAIPGSHKDGPVSEAIIDENVADHKGAAKFRFDITDDTLSH